MDAIITCHFLITPGSSRAAPPPVLPKPKLPRETRFSNPEGPFRHNPIYVKDLAHFVRAKMQEGAAYFEQVRR